MRSLTSVRGSASKLQGNQWRTFSQMVLKIVSEVRDKRGVLVLHGWLAGPEVAEFERVCAATPRLPMIDLRNLAGADADGLRALVAQRERGACLTGASPYIDLLLDRQSTAREGAGKKG